VSAPRTVPRTPSLAIPATDVHARPAVALAPARASRRISWPLTCLAVDGVMLGAAVVASQLGSPAAGVRTSPAGWLALYAFAVLGLFASRRMYAPRLRLLVLDDLRTVAVAGTLAATVLVTVRSLVEGGDDVAQQTVRLWAFAVVYLAAGRAALYWSQAKARRAGEAGDPTLIVGAGRIGRLTAKRLLEEPQLGLRPIGFLDKEPLREEDTLESLPRLPVLGASWDVEELIAKHDVRHVVVAFSTAPHHVLLRLVKRCEELGVGVSFVPRLFEKVTRDTAVDHLGGLPLLTMHPANPRGWQFRLKYGLDRAIGVALLVATSPLLAIGSLAVLLSMGRPIIYRQQRVGRDGREFDILKLRTMRPAGDDDGLAPDDLLLADKGPGGVEGADRRTPLGTLLRRTSIDELPQLLNVVRGEMSLVGPRPERPEYVELFEQYVYRYGDRHRVKSGITGWAQVHGLRGRTSLSDRVEWDNYYIENWSLWLDVKILLMTVLAVLSFREGEET
jgi:exopolysaccharide biosynthesis polyprenyl glycosylphosphotransferase